MRPPKNVGNGGRIGSRVFSFKCFVLFGGVGLALEGELFKFLTTHARKHARSSKKTVGPDRASFHTYIHSFSSQTTMTRLVTLLTSSPSRSVSEATSIGVVCDYGHGGLLLVIVHSYIRYPHGKFVRENEASAPCALMSVISPQRSSTHCGHFTI
jgi:hypothetical protein